MKRIGQLAVVCTAVLTLACNVDRRDTTTEEQETIGTAGVSAGAMDFVAESLAAGSTEVELGKLAQERAANNEVKQFAAMMVNDHTRAGDQLKQVAQQHGIATVPTRELEDSDLISRLSGMRGAEFDREYMDAMVDSHQAVINHLQSRADEDRFGENRGSVTPERSDNPAEASINQWAATTLPTARHHLNEARRIGDSLGGRTRGTAGDLLPGD